jgi:hypothetical protein
MRQQERIARIVAKRKAKNLFKRWRPNEINRYVDTHYCDYLRFAAAAITHPHRADTPAVGSQLCLCITSFVRAVALYLRQLFH